MATAGTFILKTENYVEQRRLHWPPIGKHILAQYDEDCIVVYQAFCPEIADYAVRNGKFGGPKYSFTRMTWIKTNFLWMMYRSNWAQKKNQNKILAIYISRDGFDQILKFAKGNGIRVEGRTPGNVRIQWDPDHDPKGENQRRRAVQLGIKGIPLQRFHEQYIQHIEDITDFVKQQRQHVLKNELDKLLTPTERVYRPSDEAIGRHILLDDFNDSKKAPEKDKSVRAETVSTDKRNKTCDEINIVSDKEGGVACCKELLCDVIEKRVNKGHKVDLIVCLGGSFNPVHTGHIQLLDTAIRWLEKNANYNVVAARLAVAPDSYVEKKCKRKGDKCIKAEHRLKLCELACKGHKLIKTHYTVTLSARNCGENVRKWENLRNANVAVVIGADKAAFSNGHWRWHSKSKCLTVCVGRKGKSDIVRKAYFEDFKEDLTSNPDFCLIEDELEDINSTEIRRQLCEVENDLKSAINSQSIKDNSDTLNSTEHLYPWEITTKSVPINWDEVVEEIQPLQRDTAVPWKWDEAETDKDLPTMCNGLELDTEPDYRPFCGNLHSKLEKNGTRLKTSTNALSTQSAVTLIKEDTDHNINIPSRKQVIKDFVSKGWISEAVGKYILDNFSDLYI